MFCPKCATQNVDGASYCRSCGANISLVPQALTGQLPTNASPDDRYYGRRWRRAPSIDYAIRSLTMGIAFAVMVAMTSKFSPGGVRWAFWLLIPALLFFSRGFLEFLRVRGSRSQVQSAPQPQLNSVRELNVPAAKTGELLTPIPSVTEGTTRHLETEARTQKL
ncbi:MAG TPA: zinc ribbon domain-containing protein [Pyrinomonadaceae bacterium]|jgi:hypothetical protein|nr:zinc ribbon domain-containing protein [Pyrinomonadaceae bacterium]